MAPLPSTHSPARVQVTPLVGAHLGVYLALHERVSKADLAMWSFSHQPDLTRLVQRGYGVFGVAFHHVGDGSELFGRVQNYRRSPQEVAGHLVCASEPAPQDRVRTRQRNVVCQT